ncbi:polymer-forming cytoskeletal protein [Peptococcus simiae]|uniref:bactofilin family protein n=1 Tax=Peptococcus simiae TaxID=1643805 RepID=UPI003980C6F4
MTHMLKNTSRHCITILLCLVLLALPLSAWAAEVPDSASQPEATSSLPAEPAGKAINKTLFLAENTLSVSDVVKGNAFLAGETVTFSGDVSGSVFAAGNRVIIDGVVKGNVFAAGRSIHLGPNADVRGDIFISGQSISGSETAKAAQDVRLAASDISWASPVGRAFYAGGQTINLNAAVKGDAEAQGDQVKLDAGAAIDGNFTYAGTLTKDPGAKVKGDTIQLRTPQKDDNKGLSLFFAGLELCLAAFGFWLLIRLAARSAWPRVLAPFFRRPGKSLVLGFVLLIAIPLLALFFLLTIKGIPLTFALGSMYSVAYALPPLVLGLIIAGLLSQGKGCQYTARPLVMALVIIALAVGQTLVASLPGIGGLIIGLVSLASLWLFWAVIAGCFIAANDADDAAEDQADLEALQAEEAAEAQAAAKEEATRVSPVAVPAQDPALTADETRQGPALSSEIQDDQDKDATLVHPRVSDDMVVRRSANPAQAMDPKNPLAGDHPPNDRENE